MNFSCNHYQVCDVELSYCCVELEGKARDLEEGGYSWNLMEGVELWVYKMEGLRENKMWRKLRVDVWERMIVWVWVYVFGEREREREFECVWIEFQGVASLWKWGGKMFYL